MVRIYIRGNFWYQLQDNLPTRFHRSSCHFDHKTRPILAWDLVKENYTCSQKFISSCRIIQDIIRYQNHRDFSISLMPCTIYYDSQYSFLKLQKSVPIDTFSRFRFIRNRIERPATTIVFCWTTVCLSHHFKACNRRCNLQPKQLRRILKKPFFRIRYLP